VTTDQFSVLAAVLSLAAIAVGAAALVAAFAPGVRAAVAELDRFALPLGAAIAGAATAGSLYYSEVAGYIPCEYCWYQRIAMYPIVVVLGIAAVRRDRGAAWTSLTLAAIGLAISIYHYRLQLWPDSGSSCDLTAPCSVQWVDTFGFVSIPFMAGSGFFGILGLSVLVLRSDRARDGSTRADEAADGVLEPTA
jgi:disulfide bond formation protein DsbB